MVDTGMHNRTHLSVCVEPCGVARHTKSSSLGRSDNRHSMVDVTATEHAMHVWSATLADMKASGLRAHVL